MSSEEFFQHHPVFTHEEYARSRGGGRPRTADSLLRKHARNGIKDTYGNDLEFPSAFRLSRRDGRPRGIIKIGGAP